MIELAIVVAFIAGLAVGFAIKKGKPAQTTGGPKSGGGPGEEQDGGGP